MSHENEITSDDADETLNANKELFTTAYFAALQGVAARAEGQDAGTVVNEAYKLAERTVERFTTGKSVATEAQRLKVAKETAMVPAGKGGPTRAVVTGAQQLGGVFPRPGT